MTEPDREPCLDCGRRYVGAECPCQALDRPTDLEERLERAMASDRSWPPPHDIGPGSPIRQPENAGRHPAPDMRTDREREPGFGGPECFGGEDTPHSPSVASIRADVERVRERPAPYVVEYREEPAPTSRIAEHRDRIWAATLGELGLELRKALEVSKDPYVRACCAVYDRGLTVAREILDGKRR